MSKVFVVDANETPLEPVHAGRARVLLKAGKAVVWRRYPFIIRLKREVESPVVSPWQRTMRNLPKTHYWDAVCVGASTPEILFSQGKLVPLVIEATGHGNRQLCGVSGAGFPIRHRTRRKLHQGFQTGDMVRAVVLSGKKAGRYVGRVLVRVSGYFDVQAGAGRVTGIAARFCTALHHTDGYAYRFGKAEAIPTTQSTKQGRAIPSPTEVRGHPGPVS